MSIFTKVKRDAPNYSTFNLSHQRKFSCNMGELVPCMIMETVPGDIFSSQTAQLVRLAPMVAPIMHQISIYTHFFFVPNRIMYRQWEDFITGGEDGESDVLPPTCTVDPENSLPGSLPDYLGLPPQNTKSNILAYPFAAYQMIYNQYYRDQNLQDEIPLSASGQTLMAGNNQSIDIQFIRRRAWQHDYFTSALPWTQKGPQATIPLGDTAPLILTPSQGLTQFRDSAGNLIDGDNLPPTVTSNGVLADGDQGFNMYADVTANTTVDLSQATANTIIDLRNAFRLQEWLEINARSGTRYNEAIMAHFGIDIGDARVDRPEFLGGGSQPLTISEVLQTSSSDPTTPQGNMAGHGLSAGQSSQWSYKCKEHGYIVGIMSVMPKTAYQDGVPKHWLKRDKFDYYFKSFAHVGEQPITNQEIFHTDGIADDLTFGYTPRYAEYKYVNDSVHGEFRTTLDFWHLGRKFQNVPQLSSEFIECNPDTRIFANETGEQLYVHMYHQVKARRPMPYFSNPKI